jgi:KaiC/GvpD/RAD55 family RecA-like ATPase
MLDTCTPRTECDSMSDAHHMIPSGIPPLDARLGGAITGRIHLLSGGPGTGKTTAGLQFIRQGLQLGETVAMLTSDRLADLRSHAAHLGIDLEAPLREGRLVLLRYRPSFSALLQHTASPEQMLDDLRRLFLPVRPTRVLVDTVSPLVCSAPHADLTVAALADLLESMEMTTLVTYAGDVTAGRGVGYDYRLEPLVDRAAAVFQLTRQLDERDLPNDRRAAAEPTYRFHVLRVRQPVRSSAPASYTIDAGAGLVLLEGSPSRAGARHRRDEPERPTYEPLTRAGSKP